MPDYSDPLRGFWVCPTCDCHFERRIFTLEEVQKHVDSCVEVMRENPSEVSDEEA